EALAADVALRGAVEAVADRHVVGGDRLGDGARRSAGGEERASDLLAAADLGERAVGSTVQIQRERLLSRRRCRLVHGVAQRRSRILSSTSRSRSLPKKISSPTKNVGAPKVPRATVRSVLAMSASLISRVCTSSRKRSASSPDSASAARNTCGSSI